MATSKDFEPVVDWCVQPSEMPQFTNVIGASLVAIDSESNQPASGAWDGYLRFKQVSGLHGGLEGQLFDVKGISRVNVNIAFPAHGASCSLEFHDLPSGHSEIIKDMEEGNIQEVIAGDPVNPTTDVVLGPPPNLIVHMWKTTSFESGFE